MITRSSNRLFVEGFVVSHAAAGENDTVRQLIEIDTSTGLIEKVGAPGASAGPEGADLSLGEDFLIFPGFIDVHVHAREDPSSTESYKENFRTAGLAAIHGGVTAFADMPNNPQPPIDDASYLKKREISRSCPVDVLLYAGVGPRTRPLSFPVPYKVYMGPSVGELYFDAHDDLRETIARYRGVRLSFHAEAPAILNQHKGAATHAERRPPIAEALAIETAIELSENYGVETKICHLSTADGMEIIRSARKRGTHVTCEVTPHHLFYDQDNAVNFSEPTFLQCNPPIRSRLDRIALLEAFRAGEIDYLAHGSCAPHSSRERARHLGNAPSRHARHLCFLAPGSGGLPAHDPARAGGKAGKVSGLLSPRALRKD